MELEGTLVLIATVLGALMAAPVVFVLLFKWIIIVARWARLDEVL